MVEKRGVRNKNTFCSKSFFTLFILSLVIFALHLIFTIGRFWGNYRSVIGNLFILSLCFIAVLSSILIYRRIPSNFPREKKGYFFFSGAVIFFFIGDLIWFITEVFFGKVFPLGGLPDLSWNIAYILLIISIIFFISMSFRSSYTPLILLLLVGITIGGFILYSHVRVEILTNNLNMAHIVQHLYIIYDLVILSLIIYVVWPLIFSPNRIFLVWIAIAGAIFTRLIYDQLFAWILEVQGYYTGHKIDLLYVLAYVLITLAFYLKSKTLAVRND